MVKHKRKYLTTKDVAERLQVSTRTLQRLRDSGRIRYHQDGRIVRYKLEDVESYMASNVMETFNENSYV